MDNFALSIKQEDVDALLQDSSISSQKWNKLLCELSELCEKSDIVEAIQSILNHCAGFFKITSESVDEKDALDLTGKDVFHITKRLESLKYIHSPDYLLRKTDLEYSFDQKTSLRALSPLFNITSRIESDAVLTRAIQNLPLFKISSNSDEQKQVDSNNEVDGINSLSYSDITNDFMKFLHHINQEPNLRSQLLLIKLLLSILEENDSNWINLKIPSQIGEQISTNRLLGLNDLQNVLKQELEIIRLDTFQSAKRLLPLQGIPETLQPLKVKGTSSGILSGMRILPSSGVYYFEVTMTSGNDNNNHMDASRVGWCRGGDSLADAGLPIGSTETTWGFEPYTNSLFHNSQHLIELYKKSEREDKRLKQQEYSKIQSERKKSGRAHSNNNSNNSNDGADDSISDSIKATALKKPKKEDINNVPADGEAVKVNQLKDINNDSKTMSTEDKSPLTLTDTIEVGYRSSNETDSTPSEQKEELIRAEVKDGSHGSGEKEGTPVEDSKLLMMMMSEDLSEESDFLLLFSEQHLEIPNKSMSTEDSNTSNADSSNTPSNDKNDKKEIEQDTATNLSPVVAEPKPETEQEDQISKPKKGVFTEGNDVRFNNYRRMRRIGLPSMAVRMRMLDDGVPLEIVNSVFPEQGDDDDDDDEDPEETGADENTDKKSSVANMFRKDLEKFITKFLDAKVNEFESKREESKNKPSNPVDVIVSRGGVRLVDKNSVDEGSNNVTREKAEMESEEISLTKKLSKTKNQTSDWKTGSVIGCLVNSDDHTVRFYVNGREQGDPVLSELRIDIDEEGLVPAFSCHKDTTLEFNLGDSPFKFPPVILKPSPRAAEGADDGSGLGVTEISLIPVKEIITANSVLIRPSLISSSPQLHDGEHTLDSNLGDASSEEPDSTTTQPPPILVNHDMKAVSLSNNFTIEISGMLVEEENGALRDSRGPSVMFSVGEAGSSGSLTLQVEVGGSISVILHQIGTYTSQPGIFLTNEFKHVAITYAKECSDLTLLVDGTAVSSWKLNDRPTTSSGKSSQGKDIRPLCIGAQIHSVATSQEPRDEKKSSVGKRSCQDCWSGYICEFRLWSDVRTLDAIKSTLGRNELIGCEPSLILYFRFEEGCGSTLFNCAQSVLRLKCTASITKSVLWTLIDEKIQALKPHFELPKLQNIVLHDPLSSITYGVIRSFLPSEVNEFSLTQLLAVVTATSVISATNLLQTEKWFGEISTARSLLRKSSSVKSVEDPNVLNFMLLNSILRQIVRNLHENSQSTSSETDLIKEKHHKIPLLCLAFNLLRILRLNLQCITECHLPVATYGLKYSSNIRLNKASFVSDVLITIIYFISSEKLLPNLDPLYTNQKDGSSYFDGDNNDDEKILALLNAIRVEAIATIGAGLEIFFPHTNDQAFLLECLLMKRHSHNPRYIRNSGDDGSSHDVTSQEVLKRISDLKPADGDLSCRDPLSALLSLSGVSLDAFLSAVCDWLLYPSRLSSVVPKDIRPLVSEKGNSSFISKPPDLHPIPPLVPVVAPSSNPISPRTLVGVRSVPGDLVVRGPHWRYDNQDGGSESHGIVLEVVSWLDEPQVGLHVVWSNGDQNIYCYGGRSGGRPAPRYEVSILRSKPVSDKPPLEGPSETKEGVSAATESKGDVKADWGQYKKELLYTPEEVSQSLIENIGELSKKTILKYIRENSPITWQEENKLKNNESNHWNQFSNVETSQIYKKFYDEFSMSPVSESMVTIDSLASESGCRTRLESLLGLLLLEIESSKYANSSSRSLESSSALRLLCSLQGFLGGSFGNRDSDPLPAQSLTCTPITQRLDESTFMGKSGESLRWRWDLGTWRNVDGVVDSSAAEQLNSKPKVHANLVFDKQYTADPLKISDDGKSIHQTALRQWNTAVSSTGFHPNTGIHKWYVIVQGLGKRGHCIFGVATREQNLCTFLGHSNAGWGLTSNRELFHGGTRMKSEFGHKLPTGTVLEITLDTDKGTLTFEDVTNGGSKSETGADMGLAFTNLNNQIVYPAFSLFSTGDTLTFLPGWDSNQSGVVKTIKNSTSPSSSSILRALACPSPELLSYVCQLIDSISHIVTDASSSDIRPVASPQHPLLSLCLPQILSALIQWDFLSTSQKSHALLSKLQSLFLQLTSLSNNLTNSLAPLHSSDSTYEHPSSAFQVDRGGEALEHLSSEYQQISFSIGILSQLRVLIATYISRATQMMIHSEFANINNEMIMREYLLSSFSPSQISLIEKDVPTRNWLITDLFAKGLTQSSLDSIATKTNHGPRPPVKNPFIQEVEDGLGKAHFLFQYLQKHDLTSSAIRKLGGTSVAFSTRSIFVAFLYHGGYVQATEKITDQLAEAATASPNMFQQMLCVKPPFFVTTAWHAAEGMRIWYKKMNQDKEISYDSISHRVKIRSKFLLELEAWKKPAHIDRFLQDFWNGNVSTSRSPSAVSSGAIQDTVYWRALEAELNDVIDLVISFTRDTSPLPQLRVEMLTAESRASSRQEAFSLIHSVLHSLKDVDTGSTMKAALLLYFPRAIRADSMNFFKKFSNNINSYRNNSVLKETMSGRSSVNTRTSQAPRGHYLYELTGCSQGRRKTLRGAFDRLFTTFVNELTSASARPEENHFVLKLLDCCGLLVMEEDHDLLARVMIFGALQEMLEGALTTATPPARETLATSSSESSAIEALEALAPETKDETDKESTVSNVTHAAMKLFYLLALQVATSGDSEELENSDSSNANPSLIPPQLVRARSGPATLSDSVFDMLFAELNHVIETMREQLQRTSSSVDISHSECNVKLSCVKISKEAMVVLSEATLLLICVSRSAACRHQLSTPRWLGLLLQMATFSPTLCQQRALRLLFELLPAADLMKIEIAAPSVFGYLDTFLSSSSPHPDNLESIPNRIVRAILQICESVVEREAITPLVHMADSSLPTIFAFSCIPIASEAVALIRKLTEISAWKPYIEKFMKEGLEALVSVMTRDKVVDLRTLKRSISVLYVLGGYIDISYPGSPALIRSECSTHLNEGLVVGFQSGTDMVDVVIPAYEKKSKDSHQNFTIRAVTSVTQDRVIALNRFPIENLQISHHVIELMFKVLNLVLEERIGPINKESESKAQGETKEENTLAETKEDDSNKIKEKSDNTEDLALLHDLFRVTLVRAFSTLLSTRGVGDLVESTVSLLIKRMKPIPPSGFDEEKFTISEVFRQLLARTVSCTNSAGVADAHVLEEYISMILAQRRKIWIDKILEKISSSKKKKDAEADQTTSLTNDKENFKEASEKKSQDGENVLRVPGTPMAASRVEEVTPPGGYMSPEATIPGISVPPTNTDGNRRNENKASSGSPPRAEEKPQRAERQQTADVKEQNIDPLVDQLMQMGFPKRWAELALELCHDDLGEALNYILTNGDVLESMVLSEDEDMEELMEENQQILEAFKNDGFDMHEVERQMQQSINAQMALASNDITQSLPTNENQSPSVKASKNNENSTTKPDTVSSGTPVEVPLPEGEEGTPTIENPFSYHLDGNCTKLLPIYSEPDFASEKVGALFPGDDVVAIGLVHFLSSKEEKPVPWLKVRLADYSDDVDIDQVLSESGESVIEDAIGWVPRIVNGKVIILPGSTDGSCRPLDDPPAEMYPLRATFRVIGHEGLSTEGVMCREGIETSTNDVRLIHQNEVIHVTEETINSEGLLCLHITSPTNGWVIKRKSAVQFISNDKEEHATSLETAAQKKTEELESKYTEFELLEKCDDHMERMTGTDGFRKEDRFFGGMQGRCHQPYSRKWLDSSYSSRRSRLVGHSSSNAVMQMLSSQPPDVLHTSFTKSFNILMVLYTRKILLALLTRSLRRENRKNLLQSAASSPVAKPMSTPVEYELILNNLMSSVQPEVVPASPPISTTDESSISSSLTAIEESKEGTSIVISPLEESSVAKKGFIKSLADQLRRFIRLICFRGDPCTVYDIENLPVDDVMSAGLDKGLIVVEDVIGKILQSVLSNYVHSSTITSESVLTDPNDKIVSISTFKEELMMGLITSLSQQIRWACSSSNEEQAWGDISYEEETDEDVLNHPNLHYAKWLSDVLISLQNITVTKQVFYIWILALRGASMTLKLIAFRILSSIISTISDLCHEKNSLIDHSNTSGFDEMNSHQRILNSFLTELPLTRIRLMASRRLWYEMEDQPAYSRFLQALIQFLSDIERAQTLVGEKITTSITQGHPITVIEIENIKTEKEKLAEVDVKQPLDDERPVLYFNETGLCNVQLSPQKELQGPWTVEFWLYRDDDEVVLDLQPKSKVSEPIKSQGAVGPTTEDSDSRATTAALVVERTLETLLQRAVSDLPRPKTSRMRTGPGRIRRAVSSQSQSESWLSTPENPFNFNISSVNSTSTSTSTGTKDPIDEVSADLIPRRDGGREPALFQQSEAAATVEARGNNNNNSVTESSLDGEPSQDSVKSENSIDFMIPNFLSVEQMTGSDSSLPLFISDGQRMDGSESLMENIEREIEMEIEYNMNDGRLVGGEDDKKSSPFQQDSNDSDSPDEQDDSNNRNNDFFSSYLIPPLPPSGFQNSESSEASQEGVRPSAARGFRSHRLLPNPFSGSPEEKLPTMSGFRISSPFSSLLTRNLIANAGNSHQPLRREGFLIPSDKYEESGPNALSSELQSQSEGSEAFFKRGQAPGPARLSDFGFSFRTSGNSRTRTNERGENIAMIRRSNAEVGLSQAIMHDSGTMGIAVWKREKNEDKSGQDLEQNQNNAVETGLKPIYLLSSRSGFIKIQSGGALPPTIDDPRQFEDPVLPAPFCLSIGQQGDEKIFDFCVPRKEWVHIALSSSSKTGPRSVSLFVNGKLVDSVPTRLNLPLSTIGTTKKSQSFQGMIADMRVWATNRSELEIRRDMLLDVSGMRGLVTLLRCKEGSGNRVIDEIGLLTCCTLTDGCGWKSVTGAPIMQSPKCPTYMLQEAEAGEGIYGEQLGNSVGLIQMTGVLSREGCRGATGDLGMKGSEVVTLCYRTQPLSTTPALTTIDDPTVPLNEHTADAVVGTSLVEGYLEWCERGVRSLLSGSLRADGHMKLSASKNSVIVGPPEALDWLCGFQFTGKVSEGGDLQGIFEAVTDVVTRPPVATGTNRVDDACLASELAVKASDDGSFASIILTNSQKSKDKYLYFVSIEVGLNSLGVKASTTPPSVENLQCDLLSFADPSEVEDRTQLLESLSTMWDSRWNGGTSESTVGSGTGSAKGEIGEEKAEDALQESKDGEESQGASGVASAVPFGLYTDTGVYTFEWYIESMSSESLLAIGLCPYEIYNKIGDTDGKIKSTELHSDEMVKKFAAVYFSNGDVYYLGEKFQLKSLTVDNTIQMLIDTDNGLIQFLVDNEIITEFTGINEHSSMRYGADGTSIEMVGLRPCLFLSNDGDCVLNMSLSQSTTEVKYPDWDFFGKKRIAGPIQNGRFHGVCDVSYHMGTGHWKGQFWEGQQHGVQLWIQDETVAKPPLSVTGTTETTATNTDQAAEEGVAATEDSMSPPESCESEVKAVTKPAVVAHLFSQGVRLSELPTTCVTPWITKWLETSAESGYGESSRQPISSREEIIGIRRRRAQPVVDTEDKDTSTPSIGKKSKRLVVMNDNSPNLEEWISNSSAPFILKIIFREGATVRTGIEIDENPSVQTLSCGDIVEAWTRSFTHDGIPRFQISNGWISERLRSSTQDIVIQTLRELLPKPIQYIVTRDGGARLRREYVITSEQLGVIPKNVVVEVAEKRLIKVPPSDGNNGEEVLRLRVSAPIEHIGWISEKPHILKPVEPTDDDLAAGVELARRNQIRRARATRMKALPNGSSAGTKGKRQLTLTGTVAVSDSTLFLLNKKSAGNGIVVSPDFITVSCESSGNSRATVLGTRGFTRGLHYWEVFVQSAQWGSVFIGVAPSEATNWSGYGFLNYRATQVFGSETIYGSYYKEGDTIGVLLDLDHGTIAFVKDGEDSNLFKPVVINMGVAYHNLRRSHRSSLPMLYPCFGLKGSGDQLSIKSRHWISCLGLSSKVLLKQILLSNRLLSDWKLSYELKHPIPRSLHDSLYDAYLRWRKQDMVLAMSRGGMAVPINIRADELQRACGPINEAFQIYPGRRISAIYGDGRLLGTRKGQIWYQLDNSEVGAWFWLASDNCSEFLDMVSSDRVRFDVANSDSEGSTNEVDSGRLSANHLAGVPVLTREEFDAQIEGRLWTIQEDEELTRLVNIIADKLSVDPVRISAEILETHRQETGILSNRSTEEVQVRYSALCVLNKAVKNVLPLIDFGRDLNNSLLNTIYDHKILQTLSMKQTQNLMFTSPEAAIYSSIKSVVFTRTKLSLWNLAVSETTTHTAPPPDEYEKPDGIIEVTLNRLEAHYVKEMGENLSFEERLNRSLFGQLQEFMNRWDESTLRRSFVHMQDAGQARAFFVKFVGEGVDDHGGPYRAAFEMAIGEEAEKLEIIVPSTNSKNEIGGHRDQTLLNADLATDSKTYGHFHHFGRLVGLACRHNILVPLSLPTLVWKPVVGESLNIPDLRNTDVSLVNAVTAIARGDVDRADLMDLLIQLFSSTKLSRRFISKFMHSLQSSVYSADEDIDDGYGSTVENRDPTVVSDTQSSDSHDVSQPMSSPQVSTESFIEGSRTVSSPSFHQNIQKLCQLVQHLHLIKHKEVFIEFYKGLSSVLPMELGPIFTPAEFEVLICGQSEVDLGLLKKVTEYEGVSPNDKHIRQFWEALEIMSTDERAQFINFCSGRTRLPSSAMDFPMNFKLTSPPPRSDERPDDYLPIAQTCFFSLSLPKYSSTSVCVQKLRYAISNADLMDADFMLKNAVGWENIR